MHRVTSILLKWFPCLIFYNHKYIYDIRIEICIQHTFDHILSFELIIIVLLLLLLLSLLNCIMTLNTIINILKLIFRCLYTVSSQ